MMEDKDNQRLCKWGFWGAGAVRKTLVKFSHPAPYDFPFLSPEERAPTLMTTKRVVLVFALRQGSYDIAEFFQQQGEKALAMEEALKGQGLGVVTDADHAEVYRLEEPPLPSDLSKPPGLSPLGEKAWERIIGVLQRYGLTYTGGCTAFYSPQQWQERGEKFGGDSQLIVVYDGGEVRDAFEPHPPGNPVPVEAVNQALEAEGLYFECCTCWYSAIYRL